MNKAIQKTETANLVWECKYCGENEQPECYKCVREDGKLVSDELAERIMPNRVEYWEWLCPVCGVGNKSDHEPTEFECWNCEETFKGVN